MKIFQVKLNDLQPSQLYINTDKLEAIERKTIEGCDFDPVPLKWIEARIVLTDGHTRALAAFRQGHSSISACWDDEELELEAYQVCVDWCLDVGVCTIADLDSRVVSPDQYEMLWIRRCRLMQDDLAKKRSKK